MPEKALEYAHASRASALDDLKSILRIPSISTLAEHETILDFRYSLPAYVDFGGIVDAYRVVFASTGHERAGQRWGLWRPEMAAFRGVSRFAKLVTELGLLDYWREHGWPDACQPAGASVICE